MKYDFNSVLDRKKTWSLKWDHSDEVYKQKGIFPMWVADMDFPSPIEVVNALSDRVSHPVFGYPAASSAFYESIINWFKHRHHWTIEKEWIVETPGVVPAINFSIQAFSEKGEGVVFQPPVYFPFLSSIKNNERKPIENPLAEKKGRFVMDLDDLIEKLDDSVKILILCSPHNPVGRVWDRMTLEKLSAICLERDILIVSDEIHCDLVFSPNKHIPLASMDEKTRQNTISLLAPSKTFNIAGLGASIAIIPHGDKREQFKKTMRKSGIESINLLGMVALQAAYAHGDEWLDQLLVYLKENIEFTSRYVAAHIPRIRISAPEGTYLMWLDCKKYFDTHIALMQAVVKKGQLGLSSGRVFGKEGDRFLRMNVGCPRASLKEGLDRLRRAFS